MAGPSPRNAAGPRAKLMQERLAVCPEPSLASRAQVLLQDLSNLAGKLHYAVGPLADCRDYLNGHGIFCSLYRSDEGSLSACP